MVFHSFTAQAPVPGTNTYVLLWDAENGSTTLVSGDPSGLVPAASTCDWPTITPDGRFVAFLSSATNLVTNTVAGEFHLYLRDTITATTQVVDTDTNGVGSSLLSSMSAPALSADGRFIAFESPDGSLFPDDRNRAFDTFVRDTQARTNELISWRASALDAKAPNGPSTLPAVSLSSDGRYFTFASDADNLVVSDTNGYRDVFVRDLLAGTNLLVSASTNGSSAGDGPSMEPSISSDGSKVAFSSRADNLVPGDSNHAQDVFLRDLHTAATALISVDPTGLVPGNKDSYSPILNSAGTGLLFRSLATNLVPGTSGENLFFRDLTSATTFALTTNGFSAAAVTPDGRFVAFMGSNQTAGSSVYLWDAQFAGRIYTNPVAGAADVSISPDGNRLVYWVTNSLWAVDRFAQTNWMIVALLEATRPGLHFSSDSRFLTYAAGVGPNVFPLTNNQVWLYDFQTGTNLLLSQSCNSLGSANDSSDSPDISSDGRFVAFHSAASDLVPADSNSVPDVFLFDRQANAIAVVSSSRFRDYSADNRSLRPFFSGDGQTLLFESVASDLAAGDFNASSDLFAWTLNTTLPLQSFALTISPADQRLAWGAVPGKTYRVQFKNFLSDPIWQELNAPIRIVGLSASFRDTTSGLTQRFYRVVAF